jgi:hypothetical protein
MKHIDLIAAGWRASSTRLLRAAAALLLAFAALPAAADPAELRAKYQQLGDELRQSVFGRSMHMDSRDANGVLHGDVYAVLDHPFAKVRDGMKDAAQWCDVMILPFNTKYCHAAREGGATRLAVRIGRKHDQPLEQAYRLDFRYRNVAATERYFESQLHSAAGPVGTRDYRIRVSAIPLPGDRTFMHLSYSYGYGGMGKLAMQVYLSTAGADKVGFTPVGRGPDGQPQLIGGMRGAIERNAMRYYLAIDAYLDSLDEPEHRRVERRIQDWFDATERYPRQLREMDRATYVAMKRHEYERQARAE